MLQKRKIQISVFLATMPLVAGVIATMLEHNPIFATFGFVTTIIFLFIIKMLTIIKKIYEEKGATDNKKPIAKKSGRPKGSLSSSDLTRGTTIQDMLPFLQEAKEARDKADGSFANICEQSKIPTSTVRDWLERYKDQITQQET